MRVALERMKNVNESTVRRSVEPERVCWMSRLPSPWAVNCITVDPSGADSADTWMLVAMPRVDQRSCVGAESGDAASDTVTVPLLASCATADREMRVAQTSAHPKNTRDTFPSLLETEAPLASAGCCR